MPLNPFGASLAQPTIIFRAFLRRMQGNWHSFVYPCGTVGNTMFQQLLDTSKSADRFSHRRWLVLRQPRTHEKVGRGAKVQSSSKLLFILWRLGPWTPSEPFGRRASRSDAQRSVPARSRGESDPKDSREVPKGKEALKDQKDPKMGRLHCFDLMRRRLRFAASARSIGRELGPTDRVPVGTD